MSRETEKLFRELEKHLASKELANEAEYEKEVKKFIEAYNSKIDNGKMNNSKTQTKKGKDAWDYLDMAYEADDEEEALKYAKKALKLDKTCLDAEVMITDLTSDDEEEVKRQYEKLIEKEEKRLRLEGIFSDENIGHFWGLVETRPYMRLRHAYITLLISMGKFRKAMKECSNLLELCEGDNMGVRYLLISLYAFYEDEMNAIKLHKQFDKEPSTQMLLPLIALYYKLDDYKKAESYLKKLEEVNDEFAAFFSNYEDYEMDMDEIVESGMYRPFSKEEILVALTNAPYLYSTSAGLFFWIAGRVA